MQRVDFKFITQTFVNLVQWPMNMATVLKVLRIYVFGKHSSVISITLHNLL